LQITLFEHCFSRYVGCEPLLERSVRRLPHMMRDCDALKQAGHSAD
jgi:hypothetical protein